MVAKISTASSLNSALSYNINKVEKEKAYVLSTNKVYCPSDGAFKTSDVLNDFESFMPKKYRTENPVFHVSLNPHPDDKLSDGELTSIAEEYIERMGYGDQPYIIFKHEDIDRHHIHIVSTRVNEQGKKINDKFERRKSKDITRDLEQKYGLKPAEKVLKVEKQSLKKVDVAEGKIKNQVAEVVRGVNARYHFLSFSEYKAALSVFNISAEEIKGASNGKAFRGSVYSATDVEGNKIGNPFSASTLGVKQKDLENKYATSKAYMEHNRHLPQLREKLNKALSISSKTDELRKNLEALKVSAVLRFSQDGRLYGTTFIDHSTGAVLNGSRLGKEYSANAIVEKLNAPKTQQSYEFSHRIPTKLGGVVLSEQERINLDKGQAIYIENLSNRQGDVYNAYAKWDKNDDGLKFYRNNPDEERVSIQPSTDYLSQEVSYTENTQDSSFSGLGLFSMPLATGEDLEEELFRRRMQKKKKKGRRM